MKKNSNITRQSNLVLGSYYIGKLLHYVNMNLILHSMLSQSQFGLYRGINSACFLLANLDLEEAIMRYYPSFSKNKATKASFWGWSIVANTLLFLGIIVAFIIMQLVSKNSVSNSAIYHYYPHIFFTGYVIQLAKMLKSWSAVLQRIVWPNVLQNIVLEIFIGLTLYGYYTHYLSFKVLLLSIAVPYCLHLLFMIFYIGYTGQVKISFDTNYINKKFIKSFLTYSLFVVVASKIITLLMRIDSLMLAKLWGDNVVGKYMHIFGVVLLLDIPYKVSRQSVGPLLAHAFENSNQKEAGYLFRYAVIRQLLLASFVLMILYYNMSYFLPTQNQQEYQYLLCLLGIAKVLNNFFSIGRILLVLSPYYKLSMIISGLAFINIGINWYIIRLGGLYGAASAILFTMLFLGVATFYLVWYTMRIHPFSWQLLPILTALFLLIVIEKWIPSRFSVVISCLRIGIPSVIYGVIYWLNQYVNQHYPTKLSS
ncbi:MAG: oligosaccharide flippase family protein [Bacteroidota bacterium]